MSFSDPFSLTYFLLIAHSVYKYKCMQLTDSILATPPTHSHLGLVKQTFIGNSMTQAGKKCHV